MSIVENSRIIDICTFRPLIQLFLREFFEKCYNQRLLQGHVVLIFIQLLVRVRIIHFNEKKKWFTSL